MNTAAVLAGISSALSELDEAKDKLGYVDDAAGDVYSAIDKITRAETDLQQTAQLVRDAG